MGREIRRVPPDWQHPRWTEDDAIRPELVGKLRPIFDDDYETVSEKWITDFRLWCDGKHPYQGDYKYFWEYEPPPREESYRDRKWTAEEATHLMVYETVSEGTPVTRAFATAAELIEHLATKGTDWDHGKGWDRHSAEQFVEDGFAMSAMYTPETGFKTVNEAGFYPSERKKA